MSSFALFKTTAFSSSVLGRLVGRSLVSSPFDTDALDGAEEPVFNGARDRVDGIVRFGLVGAWSHLWTKWTLSAALLQKTADSVYRRDMSNVGRVTARSTAFYTSKSSHAKRTTALYILVQ